MISILRYSNKLSKKNLTIRLISPFFVARNESFETDMSNLRFHASMPVNLGRAYNRHFLGEKSTVSSHLVKKRFFSKKKGSKQKNEEEDSDSDEDEYDETVEEVIGDSVVTRNVPSLRVDSVLKAGLGVTKKKIEKDFYALKLRINGEKVVKKALNIHVGDEVDSVRGFSPDTSKFLIVDRVIIKGVNNMTGAGMYPVKMEVLKALTIENYEDPWIPGEQIV